MKRSLSLLLLLVMLMSLTACGKSAPSAPTEAPAQTDAPAEAPKASPAVADASQMTTVEEVVEEGMVPVSAENPFTVFFPGARLRNRRCRNQKKTLFWGIAGANAYAGSGSVNSRSKASRARRSSHSGGSRN